MSQVWFTADTHFGHRRIPLYTKRRFCLSEDENRQLDLAWSDGRLSRGPNSWVPPWSAITKMDQYLIDKINEYVQPDDTLWHLGDFCFGPRNRKIIDHARGYRDRIACKTVNFCWGNHDHSEIAGAFNRTHERYELRHKGKVIVMSHYAQAVWNRSHRGAWMLYGHSHTTAEAWLDRVMPGRRSIDVGVDNAYKVLGEYRPFSFDELDRILSPRPGCSIDHHVEKPEGDDGKERRRA